MYKRQAVSLIARNPASVHSIADQDKDITVMPAICDFTGLNIVTRQVISNACACCVGMVKYADVYKRQILQCVAG